MWAEPMTPRLPAKYSNLLASESGAPTMADSNFSEGSILQHTAETGALLLLYKVFIRLTMVADTHEPNIAAEERF